MSSDRTTPVPTAQDQKIPSLTLTDIVDLREYIAYKKQERSRGFTLEKLTHTVKDLADDAIETSQAVIRHGTEINALKIQTDSHARWIAKHERRHTLMKENTEVSFSETAVIVNPSPPPSIPPMRQEMSTGVYNLNTRDLKVAQAAALAKVEAEFKEALAEQERAFNDYRLSQGKEALQAVKEENAELKADRRFAGRTAVEWFRDATVGVVLIVATYLFTRLTGK